MLSTCSILFTSAIAETVLPNFLAIFHKLSPVLQSKLPYYIYKYFYFHHYFYTIYTFILELLDIETLNIRSILISILSSDVTTKF